MNEIRMKEIRAFFSEPGLIRFIDAVRDTYRRRNVSGSVRLPQLSVEESESLTGLLQGLWKPGEDLRFPMKRLDKLLQQSGYEITIRELFACLDGQEVLTRAEEEQQAEKNWNLFIDEALQAVGGGHLPIQIVEWIECLRKGVVQGSRILRKMHVQNAEEAHQQFVYCLVALCRVWELKQTKDAQVECEAPEMVIRLPVLAAKVAKNAHAFDIKYPAGRLLWYGLKEIFSQKSDDKSGDSLDTLESDDDGKMPFKSGFGENDTADPVRSLEIRKTYRIANIADDDISSQVMLFAPHLTGRKEELVMTLRQVERLPVMPKFSGLYVVENPSVFATLLDGTLQREKRNNRTIYDTLPILLCLNGQPSAATIRFIDRCLEARDQSNLWLYYSGDFDVKGVTIAQGLARRYAKHFVPWRMRFADYERHTEYGLPLSVKEKEQLQNMRVDWDDRLCSIMLLLGVKIHQEVFVEELMHDWVDANGGEV
ncbi:TIGR02679 domain-containing protein [Brevibacillus parabrevis]|uniref:TIGR02679 domain-containing protein n=1 Tax=Brevibacillus parabrevis TaxID=54914 RepID=UPI0028D40838|nr:TIGR02679 domain-containing protein [Brevibacillus parabrevis]MED1725392.1 TIGR02679 domain-containing protein [Brevibacillus parabrevis]